MDVHRLRLFLDVSRLGSFAAAARAHGTDPSTVSRGVAALEAELGTRLFDRTTRQLAPTEDGERLAGRLAPLVDDLDAALAELREDGRAPSGRLRVSASTSFGLEVIMPALPRFREAYPNVTLDLDLTDRRVDLLEDRIDVAIRHGHLPDSALVATRLADVEYRLVANADYLASRGTPRSPGDLSGHDLLNFPYAAFAHSWTLSDQRNPDREHIVPVDAVMVLSNALALRAAAEAGLGIAILPDWALQARDLRRVLPSWRVTNAQDGALWRVMPSRRFVPPRVVAWNAFLNQLV